MATKKKFSTTNLDLASLLVSKGYKCYPQVIGKVYALFTFDEDGAVTKIAENFRKGKEEGNITSYMYARFTLKRELQQQLMNGYLTRRYRKVTKEAKSFIPGQIYYTIEQGKVMKQLWGPAQIHTLRLEKGNVYATLEEAEAAIAVLGDEDLNG